MTTVSSPRFEHHRDPLGIGESRPRLSWIVESAPAGWRQERLPRRGVDGRRRGEHRGDRL